MPNAALDFMRLLYDSLAQAINHNKLGSDNFITNHCCDGKPISTTLATLPWRCDFALRRLYNNHFRQPINQQSKIIYL